MSLQTVHFGNWATLYRADFRDVLDSLVGVDAVITDPPYANGSDYGIYQDTQMGLQALIDALMPWIAKNAKRALITPGNANQALYPKPVWTLAWVTPAGTGTGPWGFACWQPILAYGKCPYLAKGLGRRQDLFIHTETSDVDLLHPCPKPINFMKKLIERGSLEGELVFDPFMGSGTTAVACSRLNRRFIGVEVNDKFFNHACKRIEQETRQLDLFINIKADIQMVPML
jgi:DNA modification methylase